MDRISGVELLDARYRLRGKGDRGEGRIVMNAPVLDTLRLERFLLDMIRVRRFDERTIELFNAGVIKGTAHSCVGQEAIAVGACAALREDDYVVSHHRGHGHCIAKGADTTRMMAELMGRETGYCKGLGGSMHIAALDKGILGANGIVGAGLGLGTGAALSAQMRGTDQVCLVFFGDGAANEGIFHEAFNLASLWKLPVIFFCENNQFALSTAMHESTAIDRLSKRGEGYDIPGETIDGNNVEVVFDAVCKAADRARAGKGPSFIEALTWRWGDHSMRANLPKYRSDEADAEQRKLDPVTRLESKLTERQVRPERVKEIHAEANREIEAAIVEAQKAPEPTLSALIGAVMTAPSVYAAADEPGDASSSRQISMVEAIREAIDQEMARDQSVFVIGEDVGKIGGIFACTRGLIDKYGPERLRDTPISEGVISNAAVGAAITGMRPIVEIQIFDFVTLMMDAIVNQAAKFRTMLGGAPKVPIVFRGPQGGGIRLAAQHSQSLEAWFCHVPGLIVMAPSTPYDAKGLLTSAIRDDNPVVFLEHKLLYVQSRGTVPEQPYAIPIGKADIKRPGKDVTVIATMAMVAPALAAAKQLARDDGIDVEVLDPRTLRPLDTATILASVRKTNRCVIVHEGWTKFGFGAEVAAMIMEEAFDWLDAPVARIGMQDVPMPYNDTLERAVIPGVEQITAAIKAVMYRS
jgi:2-oxoisovalerate dehydrogenase E1 component